MSKVLKLDDIYSIEVDTSSWNLVRVEATVNPKTGEQGIDKDGNATFSKTYSYHPTLHTALMWYVDLRLRDGVAAGDIEDVNDLIIMIDQTEKDITQAVAGIGKEDIPDNGE